MQKSKIEMVRLAMEQCAIDLNCSIYDFSKDENVIVTPENLPGRRHFISGKFFFRMITFGGNAVIAADERIQPWLREYVKGRTGHWLFEEPHQIEINRELVKYKKPMWMTIHYYLPQMEIKPVDAISEIRWFEGADISSLYRDDRFHNALQYKINSHRPDMLAVASYENGEITGMAGASADCKKFWQIGIDVLPIHRGKGLATFLVTLLKNEIIKRGFIPYYSTSQSNIYSQNVAYKAGFFPSWVEAYSTEPRRSEIINTTYNKGSGYESTAY